MSPQRYAGLCVHVDSPSDTDMVTWADYAALQARIAELEARNAASERDAERWRWIRENANPGFTQSGKPWGLLCASLEVRTWPQIEAAIDAHAQGQAGEE